MNTEKSSNRKMKNFRILGYLFNVSCVTRDEEVINLVQLLKQFYKKSTRKAKKSTDNILIRNFDEEELDFQV